MGVEVKGTPSVPGEGEDTSEGEEGTYVLYS